MAGGSVPTVEPRSSHRPSWPIDICTYGHGAVKVSAPPWRGGSIVIQPAAIRSWLYAASGRIITPSAVTCLFIFRAMLPLLATRAALLALPALLLVACSNGESVPAARPAASAADAGTPPHDPRVARADSARIRGSADAPVWLIEVSDYQCPFCKNWHDDVFPTIIRDYVETGKVRLAYVNFPLGIHPNAPIAAEATMCAGAQGAEKYWQYHDLVFGSQARWASMDPARPAFDSLAAQAGLDGAAFGSCLDEHLMLPLVEADRSRMKAAGVASTPTFFIGDTKIEGAQPVEVFRRALDAALAAHPAAAKPNP